MKRLTTAISAVALLAGLLFPAAFGQETAPERYTGTWIVTGGAAGGSNLQFDVRINRFNTNQEISQYVALLTSGGPDALRKALEKEDLGQFSPVGRVGVPLAVARKLVDGDKTIIRVVTARTYTFAELRHSGRSVDYPYTMLDLVLDKNGNGTGSAMGAAKVSFNKKKNIYEIESSKHGPAFNKLLNVRTMK